MYRHLCAFFAFAALAGAAAAAPIVSNVTASQRNDGTGVVEVNYTLSGATGPCMVSLTFSNDNGSNWNVLPTLSLISGAHGPGITNGNHQITWDVARDRANQYWPNTKAKVTASLLGGTSTVSISGPNGATFEFVNVPAGSFTMGSSVFASCTGSSEQPTRTVNIGYDFQLGKFEVTQAQWYAVMLGFPEPQSSANPNLPVVNVSWNDIAAFIVELNELGLGTFRLPTEAEWEYACRAGSITCWQHGDAEAGLENYAWYNLSGSPRTVGQKLPNAFGLYDMHGNVWEWVQDWYHANYTGAPSDGSVWEDPVGTSRVLRGGDYDFSAADCRSAIRGSGTPTARVLRFGFRLVRTN